MNCGILILSLFLIKLIMLYGASYCLTSKGSIRNAQRALPSKWAIPIQGKKIIRFRIPMKPLQETDVKDDRATSFWPVESAINAFSGCSPTLNPSLGLDNPASVKEEEMHYLNFIVQGNGRTTQEYTYYKASSIAKDPRIDFKRKTLLLLLGYRSSPESPRVSLLTDEYESLGYNVIIVDYERFTTLKYIDATRLMRPVAKLIADVLVQLSQAGLDPGKLEIVGFSLGGQSASVTAKTYQELTGKKVSRIIALDPAGPCFNTLSEVYRLHSSDADFVQVIHTNANTFGMVTPAGHVDFYVNGGETQPSDTFYKPCFSPCSHTRAIYYWAKALKYPGKFLALKCNSVEEAQDEKCYNNSPRVVNQMGLGIDMSKTGIFHLKTSGGEPFYLGEAGLKNKLRKC